MATSRLKSIQERDKHLRELKSLDSKALQDSLKELKPEEADFFGKCGIFCRACFVFLKTIQKPGKEMRDALMAVNMDDAVELVYPREAYDTFRKVLDYFCDEFTCVGGCDACYSLQEEGTYKQCPMRVCCAEKGIHTCGECKEFEDTFLKGGTCHVPFMELIAKRYSNWTIDNLTKVNKLGYKETFESIMSDVDQGLTSLDVISSESVFKPAPKK